jgi:hypothetical protein
MMNATLATTVATYGTKVVLNLGKGPVFVANVMGLISSLVFMGMYVPQFLLNQQRKSTEGEEGAWGLVVFLFLFLCLVCHVDDQKCCLKA